MKTIITFICFFAVGFSSMAQTKNEQLFEAVRNNDISRAQNLLKLGTDVNYFMEAKSPYVKVNLLMSAVNNKSIEMAKLLLENKADVNWKDSFNNLAITYAARSGNTEMVKLLLKYGASVHDKDGNGNPVLTAAKESKNPETIAFVETKSKETNK